MRLLLEPNFQFEPGSGSSRSDAYINFSHWHLGQSAPQDRCLNRVNVVSSKLPFDPQLLHDGMAKACTFLFKLLAFDQVWLAIFRYCGDLRQTRDVVACRNASGSAAHGVHVFPHRLPQLAEQFIFSLVRASTRLENPTFPLLERWCYEPFCVAQVLASYPVIRHRSSLGFADCQEVSERAVVP